MTNQLLEQCLPGPSNAPELGTAAALAMPADGQTVRGYVPPFPESYRNVNRYLAWTAPDSAYYGQPLFTFYLNDKIAIARLAFPNQVTPFTDNDLASTPLSGCTPSRRGFKSRVRYARRDIESGLEMTSRGENEVLYGHGTVIVRVLPRFVRNGQRPTTFYKGRQEFGAETPQFNNASGKITQVLSRRYRYDDQSVIGYAGSEYCYLQNGDSAGHSLIFDCDLLHEARADGFNNAANQTHFDSYHYLNFGFDWSLYGGSKKLVSHKTGTGEGTRFGTKTYARSFKDTHSSRAEGYWPGNALLAFTDLVEYRLEAWATRTLPFAGTLSDAGSKAYFTHQLQRLEILPK